MTIKDKYHRLKGGNILYENHELNTAFEKLIEVSVINKFEKYRKPLIMLPIDDKFPVITHDLERI